MFVRVSEKQRGFGVVKRQASTTRAVSRPGSASAGVTKYG